MQRAALDQQPSQLLIIDTVSNSTRHLCTIVADLLMHIVPSTCILPGPTRLPHLSVVITDSSAKTTLEVSAGLV